MRRTDCLNLLGLDEAATADEIKIAYWRLAKELHPDTNSSPEAHDAFVCLTKAYRQLRVTAAQHLPVSIPEPVSAPETVIVPQPSAPAAAPRAARPAPVQHGGARRWLGFATFALTATGVLLAAVITLRALDTASLGRERQADIITTPALPTPALPIAAPAIPATTQAPAATAIPPVLMGRSAREGSTGSTSPTPLVTSPTPLVRTEPRRQTEPLREASRADTSPVALPVPQRQVAPIVQRPSFPRAAAPIIRRQTIPTASLPNRRAPVAGGAGQPGRWIGGPVRDRTRQTRNEPPERRKTSLASPARSPGTLPQTSFDALTRPSLDLLRSALGVR